MPRIKPWPGSPKTSSFSQVRHPLIAVLRKAFAENGSPRNHHCPLCSFGIDNALNVLADMASVLRPRCHGTSVRICQRYLPIRRCFQFPAQGCHAVYLQPDPVIMAGQMGYFFRVCLASCLPIRPPGLLDIAAELLFQMRPAAGDLRLGTVPVGSARSRAGNRRWSCGRAPDVRSAASPRHCLRSRARGADWTGCGSVNRR